MLSGLVTITIFFDLTIILLANQMLERPVSESAG